MSQTYAELNPGRRVLMGPGPSDCHPRVLRAMSTPLVGHLDPDFLAIMDEVQTLLRTVFRTQNRLTIPVSGTGSAGMETCLCNLIEPGDRVVICVHGVFGERMSDIVGRLGGELVRVEAEWGKTIDPAAVKKALDGGKKIKLAAIVHAETSTGAWQPLEEISKIVHDHGALFIVDTVTSLGGCPVEVDKWGIDAVYSGTQKCLSCPPGLAPISFNDRAVETLKSRKSKVVSWYLDMTMVEKYWGAERVYHHTAPITMNYAIREALRLVVEEGLENRWARHERNHKALVRGLEALGFEMLVKEGERLWMLNTVKLPSGLDDVEGRKRLLQEYGIEVGGGLGALKGKCWRIGLMGETSRMGNVLLLLSALGRILKEKGIVKDAGLGVAAV